MSHLKHRRQSAASDSRARTAHWHWIASRDNRRPAFVPIERHRFANHRASPNYSFKPNPLRGIACVPALRLHAIAATARVGLTQVLGSGHAVSFSWSRNLIAPDSPSIYRPFNCHRNSVHGFGIGGSNVLAWEVDSGVRLRMVEHGPPTHPGLHQVRIGSRLESRPQHHLFANHPAWPNYSFKPTPLRSFTFALTLR